MSVAKIIPVSAPPSEFPLYFREGIVSTEHGNICVTKENLDRTLALFSERGRAIAGDYEHRSGLESPDERTPFYVGRFEVRNGMLWACDVAWTAHGAQAVASGDFLFTSIELRESTAFALDDLTGNWLVDGPLDIKRIALTNDPAVYGATPIRPDVTFSIRKTKPTTWRFSMAIEDKKSEEEQPKEMAAEPEEGAEKEAPEEGALPTENEATPPPVAEPAPAPVADKNETFENQSIGALTQILDGLMARADLPADAVQHLTSARTIVSQLMAGQEKEASEMAANSVDAVNPIEAKTVYSIVKKHLGNVSHSKLEALLFSAGNPKPARKAKENHDNEKKALLALSIERGIIPNTDDNRKSKFLSMSIDACREFCEQEGVKTRFSVQLDPAKLPPMPSPSPKDAAKDFLSQPLVPFLSKGR